METRIEPALPTQRQDHISHARQPSLRHGAAQIRFYNTKPLRWVTLEETIKRRAVTRSLHRHITQIEQSRKLPGRRRLDGVTHWLVGERARAGDRSWT